MVMVVTSVVSLSSGSCHNQIQHCHTKKTFFKRVFDQQHALFNQTSVVSQPATFEFVHHVCDVISYFFLHSECSHTWRRQWRWRWQKKQRRPLDNNNNAILTNRQCTYGCEPNVTNERKPNESRTNASEVTITWFEASLVKHLRALNKETYF